MPKSERQKLKLLYLRDYLCKNTDEAHPAGMQSIIDYLAAQGIPAERKSIYNDIQNLNDYGIQVLYKGGRYGGYYVAQRDFELHELKLLVDAVLSSRFLSSKQSMQLIKKMAALSSSHESELLRRELVISVRVKTDNEDAFSNIDLLHEAIGSNSRISFLYFEWVVDLKKHFRNNTYCVSRDALLWNNENYYLLAHSESHGLTHYRVDKMEQIQLTGTPRIFTEEARQFDPASYSKEIFGMYRAKRKRVKLRFENALAGVVVDRFGRDIMLLPDGKEHFTLTVNVSFSPNFLGWIAGFGGRAAIIFPKSAVEEYRKLCQNAILALPEG